MGFMVLERRDSDSFLVPLNNYRKLMPFNGTGLCYSMDGRVGAGIEA